MRAPPPLTRGWEFSPASTPTPVGVGLRPNGKIATSTYQSWGVADAEEEGESARIRGEENDAQILDTILTVRYLSQIYVEWHIAIP